MKQINEVELALWFDEWQKNAKIDEIKAVYESVNGVTLEAKKLNHDCTYDVIEI